VRAGGRAGAGAGRGGGWEWVRARFLSQTFSHSTRFLGSPRPALARFYPLPPLRARVREGVASVRLRKHDDATHDGRVATAARHACRCLSIPTAVSWRSGRAQAVRPSPAIPNPIPPARLVLCLRVSRISTSVQLLSLPPPSIYHHPAAVPAGIPMSACEYSAAMPTPKVAATATRRTLTQGFRV